MFPTRPARFRFSAVLPCLLACVFAVISLASFAQNADEAGSETLRIRIENLPFGRIEISTDGGAHYALIGRVLHPTATTRQDKVATTVGIVLRGDSNSITFTVAPHRAVLVRPYVLTHKKGAPLQHAVEPYSVITDLEAGHSIFAEMQPPFRTQVRLQSGAESLSAIPDAYIPTEDDVFVFLVNLPSADKAVLAQRIETLAESYAASALARARAAKRSIVSGLLTLHAKLPVGEPVPIAAVTYAIDNDTVAAQNHPPYTYAWDTRKSADGEHVVEIRALNASSSVITRVRTLVYVHNDTK